RLPGASPGGGPPPGTRAARRLPRGRQAVREPPPVPGGARIRALPAPHRAHPPDPRAGRLTPRRADLLGFRTAPAYLAGGGVGKSPPCLSGNPLQGERFLRPPSPPAVSSREAGAPPRIQPRRSYGDAPHEARSRPGQRTRNGSASHAVAHARGGRRSAERRRI